MFLHHVRADHRYDRRLVRISRTNKHRGAHNGALSEIGLDAASVTFGTFVDYYYGRSVSYFGRVF